MRRYLVIWRVIAAAWAVKIFWLSTEGFSGSWSRTVLAHILTFVGLSLSPDVFEMVHMMVRKLAHMFEYAVLSLLLYWSFGGTRHWQPHLAAYAVLGAALYSLTDEFHQSFVRGRGASLIDCGFDTAGAVLAMLAVYWSSSIWMRLRKDAA